ncbi:hypothetical protein CPB84DRAFT_1812312 [Gymnopilus junonius]|uniref:Uncharacterized protein n=1 Tax=Gymnopilus junonius TaxID=109634 RepID=A0A9P5TUF6_GYMJU|nr:hypothetical protein CPB84DRAFT_1812312 [Gymnopilus junonius]
MKGNTLHFVYGIMEAICHGGHYYITCLMQQTLQGTVHAFVLNKFLTNTQHFATQQVMCRILLFYHLGLVDGSIPSSGLLNLLSVCVLVVLGNVLDFCTYSAPNQANDKRATPQQKLLMDDYDVNSISYNERVACCYARGVALYVMKWVCSCTVITGPNGEVVDDLPSQFFVQILNSLLTYKRAAVAKHLDGVPHCSVSLLERQAFNVVECDATLQAMWSLRSEIPADSLELNGKSDYNVKWKQHWEPQWRSKSQNFVKIGITPLDTKYFLAMKRHSQSAHQMVPEDHDRRRAKRARVDSDFHV